MRNFKWAFLFLVALFGHFLVLSAPASALRCTELLRKNQPKQEHLRFMSLNTLNLYLHEGKYLANASGELVRVNQDHLPREKPERHTKALADVIVETRPDFIMLQEVERYASLERFNRRYLNEDYKMFMPATNDTRKIGIAFLVHKDLDVRVRRKSFHDRRWVNKKGIDEPLFTRNFPIFEIFVKDFKEPRFVIAGVHYKSRRDRAFDPKSFYKRQAEIDESIDILKSLKEKYPNAGFVVMGDFNTSRKQKEIPKMIEDLRLVDAHASSDHFVDPEGLGASTFVFFAEGVEKKERAYDMALLSSNLMDHLISSSVYRYKDQNGEALPIPESFQERELRPSDHYPILFDLKLESLFGSNVKNEEGD